MNPYVECPQIETKSFLIRRIKETDTESLFSCYNDKKAVERMNDDNCDFGFFAESKERMGEIVEYWIDFYKKHYFIRFSVVNKENGKAVGTLEGFDGETGVLRLDISDDFEKIHYLTELFQFAKEYFKELFGNEYLVTKAVETAEERRMALEDHNWEFIDTFRNYHDYYRIKL